MPIKVKHDYKRHAALDVFKDAEAMTDFLYALCMESRDAFTARAFEQFESKADALDRSYISPAMIELHPKLATLLEHNGAKRLTDDYAKTFAHSQDREGWAMTYHDDDALMREGFNTFFPTDMEYGIWSMPPLGFWRSAWQQVSDKDVPEIAKRFEEEVKKLV
jgi:hypothetical protein